MHFLLYKTQYRISRFQEFLTCPICSLGSWGQQPLHVARHHGIQQHHYQWSTVIVICVYIEVVFLCYVYVLK